MRDSLLLFLSLLLLAAGAGCIVDGDGAATETTSQGPADSDGAVGDWAYTAEGLAEYVLAVSRDVGPQEGVLVVSGCGMFAIDVPEGGEEVDFRLQGPGLNASRPGAGYGTFKVKHLDDSEFREPPDHDRPSEDRRIQVEDPRAGEWHVWVWPWHVAVNQVYTLEVQMTGQGTDPGQPPPLEPMGPCAQAWNPLPLTGPGPAWG